MPECVNGHHVTERYIRVMWPEDEDKALACPQCEDVIPDRNGGVRKARAPRQQ